VTAKYDLIILAGEGIDPTTLSFRWKDNSGAVVDLTGWAGRSQIRSDWADGPPLADWSTANSKMILGGASGTISFNVSASETSALWSPNLKKSPLKYVGRETRVLGFWDIELTPPNSAVRRFVQGDVWIVPEATR
jgi:hypothetical protein